MVIAHSEVFPHAFTRKEFLDGVISATKAKAENIREIAVGERSGITVPTRFAFKNAGYPEIIKKQNTQSNDMLLKTWKTLWACLKHKNSRYIHAKGCPVSVGDHVHYLSSIGNINNVKFDARMLIPLNVAYWKMRLNRLLNRFIGN